MAPPPAEAMIESLRALGYSLGAALADLIDNSVSAGAQNIWVQLHWQGAASIVSILDDGRGMSEEGLIAAMRPGSKNPLDERDENDLGRFGLGLKTASFSQSRRLTVASKQKGKSAHVRCWDLDYVSSVNSWRLLKPSIADEMPLSPNFEQASQGTLVIWEKLDRIMGSVDAHNRHAHDRFLSLVEEAVEHLGMIFHRFLEGSRPRLRIFVNGFKKENLVEAWDPFFSHHIATQPTPAETIPTSGGIVTVQGYVVPHKDRLDPMEFNHGSGPAGWNAQQGFYVYRSGRMLVAGDWLSLGRPRGWTKEEHYKLARLSLDIPNSLDSEWKIDVRKSTAKVPDELRDRLRGLAENVRKAAREVYSHRGRYGGKVAVPQLQRLWLQEQGANSISYRINKEHPAVSSLFDLEVMKQPVVKQRVTTLLRLLETTVPYQQIWIDMADKPDASTAPSEKDRQEVARVAEQLIACLADGGISRPEAVRRLRATEPFDKFPEVMAALMEKHNG